MSGTGLYFAELSEVCGTGIDVVPIPDTGTNSGTDVLGIDVVPNLPKCSVPVLMSYRTFRSVRFRY